MKTSWPSKVRGADRTHSFICFLQDHYQSRRVKNSRYSLRAFAKYLGINHSTLSQLLRGKRRLTNETIIRIGQRLGLGEHVIDSYLSPKCFDGSSPSGFDEDSRQLELDTFEVISDWHHFALLELIHLKSFKPDTRWIASVLGITQDAVNIAISRLLRLGLLRMMEDGTWEDRLVNATMSKSELSDVVRSRVEIESHERAIIAIEQTPPERRDQASMTVAINAQKLPQITELTSQFKHDLEAIIDQDDQKDDVYRIEISVFPVTTLYHRNSQNLGNNQMENDHD